MGRFGWLMSFMYTFCCPEQVRNESVYQQEEEATAYIR